MGLRGYAVSILLFALFATLQLQRKLSETFKDDVLGPAPDEVFLVSSCSFDRLRTFMKIAQKWEGPVIIAVACTNEQQVEDVRSLRRPKNILLTSRMISPSALYPVNMLRNVAVDLVPEGSVMLLTDADMQPSADAYKALQAYVLLQRYTPKLAVVLPAFEVGNSSYDTSAQIMPNSREDLRRYHNLNVARQFKGTYFVHGHGCTDYERWWSGNDIVPYKAKCWSYNYEPYFSVLKTRNFPRYRENFVGWGGNRVSHVIQLWMTGYRFYVEPQGFLCHLPHPPQRESEDVRRYAQDTNMQLLQNLYIQLHTEWASAYTVPFLTRAMYSISAALVDGPPQLLSYNCGDVLEVLNTQPFSNKSVWLAKNNLTGSTGFLFAPTLSLSWQEGVWCPKREHLPQLFRQHLHSITL